MAKSFYEKIGQINEELKEREELTKSAIQSKENTINKLEKLKELIDKKYKNTKKTEKIVKQLYSLYSFCQISDQKINTKEKLAKFIDNYCNNELDYEYNEYNRLYRCNGLKEFNDFDECCYDFNKKLTDILENNNMNKKKIYLDYYFYDSRYKDYDYDDRSLCEENIYRDEDKDTNRVICFDVLCSENNSIKSEIYSYEKILELILSGKIIVANIDTIGRNKLQNNLYKKIKNGDLWNINRDKIISDISVYSLNNYIKSIQSINNNNDYMIQIYDSIAGGIWDIDKSQYSKLSQIFPKINQFAYELIIKKIDMQIANQNKELIKIKQEYSEFLQKITKAIKSQKENIIQNANNNNYVNIIDNEIKK